MKNYVSIGDYYRGKVVLHYKHDLHIRAMQGFKITRVPICPETIKDYDAPLSANEKGLYTVAIKWKDGRESVLQLDPAMNKQFLKTMI